MRAIFFCWGLGLFGLASAASSEKPTRSFYMGFNPWPYEATLEAVEWTYRQINAKGDIIAQHIEEGVPWPEAFEDKPFSADYQDSLQMRLKKTAANKKVFLSVNPINPGRNGMALYRGSGMNMPLPAPWDSYELDSLPVKTAYLNYIKKMISLFKPIYLAIGIEVNLLLRSKTPLWSKYMNLHRFIYAELKKTHPDLVVMASIDVNALLEDYSGVDDYKAQSKAFEDLIPYVDHLGISLHPFMSRHRGDLIPEDLFEKVFRLSKKPVSITESSYIAQPWTIEVNGTKAEFKGSIGKQKKFILELLTAAQKYSAPMVILFTIRDYDQLWKSLGKPDGALPWRDTGLYDEQGLPRPALGIWEAFLGRERKTNEHKR